MKFNGQKYSILYLEDDDKDKRITKFKEMAEEAGFYIQIINNPIQFLKKIKRGTDIIKYDVIICDIEIWQKSKDDNVNLLIGLGFSYIDELIKNNNDYIYIIISNTPTSFFSKITAHIHDIKEVRQKDKIFQSVDSIKRFIEELKQYIDDKEQNLIEKIPNTISIFEVYNNYIHQQASYPLTITLKSITTTCSNYDNIENIIEEQLEWLVSEWTTISNNFEETKWNDKMRDVASKLKLGGEFRRNEILFRDIEINNFIRKLILRRFAIYLVSKNNKLLLKKACLTISGQEKCFDNILLFSHTSNQFSKEEKEFQMSLKNNS